MKLTIIKDNVQDTIDNLKKNYLTKENSIKRAKNNITIETFMKETDVYYDDTTMTYHGGVFSLPVDSMFLFEILIEKFPNDFDFSDPDANINLLNSERGKKIQKARMREIIRKSKKFCKNRKVIDKNLSIALVAHFILGDIRELVTHLDNTKNYDIIEVNKFIMNHH